MNKLILNKKNKVQESLLQQLIEYQNKVFNMLSDIEGAANVVGHPDSLMDVAEERKSNSMFSQLWAQVTNANVYPFVDNLTKSITTQIEDIEFDVRNIEGSRRQFLRDASKLVAGAAVGTAIGAPIGKHILNRLAQARAQPTQQEKPRAREQESQGELQRTLRKQAQAS